MNDLVQVITNSGLGVASFLALLYFINKYMATMTDSMKTFIETIKILKDKLGEISKVLQLVQGNLLNLQNRVNKIEEIVQNEKSS